MVRNSLIFLCLLIVGNVSAASALDDAFAQFSGGKQLSFSAENGKALWTTVHISKKDGKKRQCATCHGEDLTKTSKHVKTGKPIDPMAPSVNKERFTDLKKINKWLKRNCKWTIGRVCTNQEKGDLLKFLSQL